MKNLNKKLIAVAVVALATAAMVPAAYAKVENPGGGNKPVTTTTAPSTTTTTTTTAPAPTTTSSFSSLSTVITDPNALDGNFDFVNFKGKAVTFTYDGAMPTRIAAGTDDGFDQSPESVGTVLKTVFSVDPLKTVSYGDAGGSNESSVNINDGLASFTSKVAFNYLAIHLGGTEVFFDFGSTGVAAGKTLSLKTTGQGFSNFRAYSTIAAVTPPPTTPGTSPVPVPGAVWLFGSGLAGLIGMRKRKAAGSALTA